MEEFKKSFFKERSIVPKTSILDALKLMDVVNTKLLIINNNDGTFFGLVSIGDIQRAILKNENLQNPVENIIRKSIRIATVNDSFDIIKKTMIDHRIEFMPVLGKENKIEDIYLWEEIIGKVESLVKPINLPVVIMAGGFGKRLKPLTNILPKPLLPIGDKTIIERIIDNFMDFGCNEFYVSVNYKAEMIKHYFSTLDINYKIYFFQETEPLGTAGSIHLIKDRLKSAFFVSNCDILIKGDYSDIYNYHKENKNDFTIISTLKHLNIPYGTLEFSEKGFLTKLVEKPELTFKINSGMYVMEPWLLDEIPENKFFHITDLIEKLMKKNKRVGVFPLSENAWTDIGEWNQYLTLINKRL